MFFYNIWNTVNQLRQQRYFILKTMTVNPNLESLMRVIEENQTKITEGEYLEAMNALCALHREQEQNQHRQQPQPHHHYHQQAFVADADAAAAVGSYFVGNPPHPPPPSYADSTHLFASAYHRVLPPGLDGNRMEQRAWERVRNHHPDPFQNRISAEEWTGLSYEDRFRLVREATDHLATTKELLCRTPDPTICPFITRHAVGTWNFENDGNTEWECVCGYTGKVKNWKKHEQSERHIDWAKHRTVSRRKIQKMKTMIHDDEFGYYVRYACYAPNPAELYPGGIRIFPVWQDKNEWTHPELFPMSYRSPIQSVVVKVEADEQQQQHQCVSGVASAATDHAAAAAGATTWFVQPRIVRSRQYIE